MCPARIRLDRCDILTVKADACICSIHRSRDMTQFPLSKHVLRAAGNAVQMELNKSSSEMSIGEVEMTDAGRLTHFQKLLFICLKTYIKGNETVLQQSLIECLELAAVAGLATVAVPALGTGGLNYPAQEVARATVEAVGLHNIQYPETSITTVNIVLLDNDLELIKTYLRMCAVGSTSLNGEDEFGHAGLGSQANGSNPNQSLPSSAKSPPSQNPSSTNNGQRPSGTISRPQNRGAVAHSSLFSNLVGLFSKIGFAHTAGIFHFTIRPTFNGRTVGISVSAGIDVSFLESFIPPPLKKFFKDLGL